MKIELDRIKPSPKPIRTTWDEEKMSELSQSLIEEGQVEPIGVHASNESARRIAEWGENHENNDLVNFEVEIAPDPEWTIVWGHRRVEAARRAGWDEIEAVIVPQDEIKNLIQAGIENLSKEEMGVDDKAEWAHRLVTYGLSHSEIGRRSGISRSNITKWLTYWNEKESGVVLENSNSRDEGLQKILYVANVLGNDVVSKNTVLKKATDESLNREQTQFVAEAYRDAPTPEVKKKILDLPVMSRDTAADILRRSINSVRMETGVDSMREMNEWEKERDERRAFQDFDFAVKEFLDSMKMFQQIAQKGSALVKYGKYSPEAAKFAIRKIDALIDDLKNYREALEGVE